jgi:DMSO/TMAO reductase YedYZ molybdopterin-dependent catalytic subunit
MNLFGKDPKQQEKIPLPTDAPEGAIISEDTYRENRVPPNQSRTAKWPVLDTGIHPKSITLDDWAMRLDGLVVEEKEITGELFRSLPRVKVFADMHCVTRWSRLGNLWEGVSTREMMKHLTLAPGVKFVTVWAYDEPQTFRGNAVPWTTNMPIEEFLGEDCLFADTHDGEPLTLEHGGPVRLIIPKLYAWKSAKWVRGVHFQADDEPGFWERGGYHMLGDPWKEQRFRFS